MKNEYRCRECNKQCTLNRQDKGTLGTWRCPTHGKVAVRRVKVEANDAKA